MPVFVPKIPPALPEDYQVPAELTEQQTDLYADVLEHFANASYVIPGVEKGELIEEEKFWLSKECLLRYLRAVKWKTANAAILRIEDTLKWRRDYGLYTSLSAELVEPEAVTGKEVLFGFDVKRRPAFYMFPSRQNTDTHVRQIQYTVWLIERCIDLMGPGVETLDLMINFADKAQNPSLGVARSFVNILQNHYPERLGTAILINVPWLVSVFLNAIKVFLDPLTAAKMQANPKIFGTETSDAYFTKDQVLQDGWEGGEEFVWRHEDYWPALVNMCDKRRKSFIESWKKQGATIGLSEFDYKTKGQESSKPSALTNGVVAVSQDDIPQPEPTADD